MPRFNKKVVKRTRSKNKNHSAHIKIWRLGDDLSQVPQSIFSFTEAVPRVGAWKAIGRAGIEGVVVAVFVFVVRAPYPVGRFPSGALTDGHVVEDARIRPVVVAGLRRRVTCQRRPLGSTLRDKYATAEAADED